MAAIHPPSQQQQYCLKWNSFHTNMSDVFQSMLVHENLVDVTLACEDTTIKAHKMILAACSPYFQNLFMSNPCKHPIIILQDVKFIDLKAIIDFIYSGEVNIPQGQLNSLLKAAETLKIKGLADFGEKQLSNSVSLKNNNSSLPINYSSFTFNKKRKRPRIQYSLNNNSSAINNNNSIHKTYSKTASNNVSVQPKDVANGENGDSSEDDEEEGGNSSPKPAGSDKGTFFGSAVSSSPSFKNTTQPQQSNMYERDDSEEFEPTKLLEQSMSTPENTGVDYSPEENDNDVEVQSGDEEEGEDNSKSFMDDEYSSNNSNTDLSVLPVGMSSFANQFVNVNSAGSTNGLNGSSSSVSRTIEEYETLLSEIQQKNLTTCPICSKEFIKKSKLIRHYHTHFSDFRPKFSCVFCGKLFTTQDWCKRHALNCQLKQYQHISHLDLYND